MSSVSQLHRRPNCTFAFIKHINLCVTVLYNNTKEIETKGLQSRLRQLVIASYFQNGFDLVIILVVQVGHPQRYFTLHTVLYSSVLLAS